MVPATTSLLFFSALTALWSQPAPSPAPAPAPRPSIWIMPPGNDNGDHFRELFDHPEQWAQTRAKITGIGIADWQLSKNFSDAELHNWAQALTAWNLKFSLEVGAIKPWGPTGQLTFDKEHKHWDKYIGDGGTIDAIAMDEPLNCTRYFIHQPDEYAVEQTAQFIQLVREHYPTFRIGDIEGYPANSYDDLRKWIDALQANLKAKNVPGLDFFRVDVDWVHFIVDKKGSWSELKQLEMFCRARHIPFSLVYWAADLPALRNRGLANDATWYISTMQMGNDYAIVRGQPDEMVLESWVAAPAHAVPETDPWTFTRTALDFCNTFVK
jgi:hypothetical protein